VASGSSVWSSMHLTTGSSDGPNGNTNGSGSTARPLSDYDVLQKGDPRYSHIERPDSCRSLSDRGRVSGDVHIRFCERGKTPPHYSTLDQ